MCNFVGSYSTWPTRTSSGPSHSRVFFRAIKERPARRQCIDGRYYPPPLPRPYTRPLRFFVLLVIGPGNIKWCRCPLSFTTVAAEAKPLIHSAQFHCSASNHQL
ncbi:hypothetical protein RSAG8_07383, partial [Rhizoctonia solani AG-8 WAC10335]